MARERERVPDWEHLLFAALLLAFVVWYLWTAAAASPTFSNLILIGPVGAVAAALLLYIGASEIFGRAEAAGAMVRTSRDVGERGAWPLPIGLAGHDRGAHGSVRRFRDRHTLYRL